MKTRIVQVVLVLAILFSLTAATQATTWSPQEVVCPLCKTKNTFQVVMSYGSYIYQWPSKYEYIFWPLIDSPVLYSCKQCHLTAFMWDYEKIPKEKFPDIQKALEGVKLSGTYKDYTAIPMSERLGMAEKVYGVLAQDDEFWCRFYRVMGYHCAAEKQRSQADESRKKALARAEKMLSQKENAEIRKELLLITGAMRHFLIDDAGAMSDFKAAQALKYQNTKMTQEQNDNINGYLSALLDDYIKKLQEAEKTKLKG